MAATIEKGTILASTWGYEQTNVDFFRVVKRTPKTVTLIRLETKKEYVKDGAGAGMYGTALPGEEIGVKPFRRTIKTWEDRTWVNINSYATASPWGGEPVGFSEWH